MQLITTRRIWTASIIVAILAVSLVAYTVYRVARLMEGGPVAFHQRSVTRSLAEWEQEYCHVRSRSEARHAADMLEYVQQYYVPAPGYHSNPKTEAELEAQRAKTVAAIVAALRAYTGEDFGTDATRWRAWTQKRSAQDEVK